MCHVSTTVTAEEGKNASKASGRPSSSMIRSPAPSTIRHAPTIQSAWVTPLPKPHRPVTCKVWGSTAVARPTGLNAPPVRVDGVLKISRAPSSGT